jgi:hypothetical protein
VFNVLQGDKEAVDGLLNHADIQAISFVGSTPIARYIYETASKNGKRVQALGGAKNHMLVLPDADLDLVADSAINAGFGSAGERCMAISVVVAVEPVADQLISRIADRIKQIKVGDGRRSCDMGPLVTLQHRDKVASYIDIANQDGATVVVDGREQGSGGQLRGDVDGLVAGVRGGGLRHGLPGGNGGQRQLPHGLHAVEEDGAFAPGEDHRARAIGGAVLEKAGCHVQGLLGRASDGARPLVVEVEGRT